MNSPDYVESDEQFGIDQSSVPQLVKTKLVYCVAISPDEKCIAASCFENDGDSIVLWNINDGQKIGNSLIGQEGIIRAINFSPCGRFLISGGDDCIIDVWDLTNMLNQHLFGHKSPISSLAYSENGDYIISGSMDSTIIIWKAKQMKNIYRKFYQSEIHSMSFFKTQMAIGTKYGKIIITDYKYPKILIKLDNQSLVTALQHSMDGKIIASGSQDRYVRIWSIYKRQQIHSYNHEGGILTLCISPDMKYLISAGLFEGWNILNLETKQQRKFKYQKGIICSVKYTQKNGSYLIIGASYGLLIIKTKCLMNYQ